MQGLGGMPRLNTTVIPKVCTWKNCMKRPRYFCVIIEDDKTKIASLCKLHLGSLHEKIEEAKEVEAGT